MIDSKMLQKRKVPLFVWTSMGASLIFNYIDVAEEERALLSHLTVKATLKLFRFSFSELRDGFNSNYDFVEVDTV